MALRVDDPPVSLAQLSNDDVVQAEAVDASQEVSTQILTEIKNSVLTA